MRNLLLLTTLMVFPSSSLWAKQTAPLKPVETKAQVARASEKNLTETSSVSLAPVPVKSSLRRRTPKSRFTSVMSLGYDMRAERDQEQSTLPRAWPTLSLGFGLRPWMGVLEYSNFTERSGNSTLSVERKAETLLLWGQWTVEEQWELRPYLGLGLGGYRNWAEIDLYSQKTAASGRWIEHAAGAFGLRWARISPIYFSVEGRVHVNRELDPNPTLSALIKLGFVIE